MRLLGHRDANFRAVLISKRAVYIGNTAAISFLDFVRKTLRHCAGPSAFTESQQRHIMLEATVQTNNSGHFKDDLEDSDKINLIQHFLDAVSLLRRIFDHWAPESGSHNARRAASYTCTQTKWFRSFLRCQERQDYHAIARKQAQIRLTLRLYI